MPMSGCPMPSGLTAVIDGGIRQAIQSIALDEAVQQAEQHPDCDQAVRRCCPVPRHLGFVD